MAIVQWPSNLYELKKIEDLVTCGICYEYMETPVLTICSHNFCSICIRKYLSTKNRCPSCFKEIFDKDLMPNRVLTQIIAYLSRFKSKVPMALEPKLSEPVNRLPRLEDSLSAPIPAEYNRFKSPLTSPTLEKMKMESSPLKKSPTKICFPSPSSSPGPSGMIVVPKMFTPLKSQKSAQKKSVQCPVCKVDIFEVHLNRHLDDCLRREEASKTVKLEPSQQKRKPLPKLVLRLMKEQEIRKKLREFGLQAQGDRKTLESRYQRYLTLYNAECDKLDPRPVADVLRQCIEEERVDKNDSASQDPNKLNVTRDTDPDVIVEEQRKYLDRNRPSFQALIDNIKSRKQKSPSKPSTSRAKDDGASVSYLEMADSNQDTDGDNEAYYTFNDGAFQDNDSSNSSCPLQMYVNNDVTSFLKINMSGESSNDNIESTIESTIDIVEEKPNVSELELNKENTLNENDKDSPSSFNIAQLLSNVKTENTDLPVKSEENCQKDDCDGEGSDCEVIEVAKTTATRPKRIPKKRLRFAIEEGANEIEEKPARKETKKQRGKGNQMGSVVVKLEEPVTEADSSVVTKRRRGRPKKVENVTEVVVEQNASSVAATGAKRMRVLKETNNNNFLGSSDDENGVEIVGQWRTVRRKIEKTPTEGDFPRRMTRSNSKLSDAELL